MGKIWAISGCTNAGKTTLARNLAIFLGEEKTKIINQDDYYYTADKVEKLYIEVDGKDVTQRGFYWSYDEKESVDVEAFRLATEEASKSFKNVIIEGNMITEMADILKICSKVIVMTLDMKTCKTRRDTRTYDPPDDIGYFDYVAWPAYQRHVKRAIQMGRTDDRFTYIDVSNPIGDNIDSSNHHFLSQILNDHVKISENPLSIDNCQNLSTSPSCGAISLFVGTTRDNFDGKQVIKLSYDCYDEMAYKEMRKICRTIREQHPGVEKVVIHHRIGDVPVCESSVIIATSSAHRAESIKATELAINLLKKHVPIWKKEVYSNDEYEWKSNQLDADKAASQQ